MKARILAALGLIALLAVGAGYARQVTNESLKATIDFPFMVEGKTLPAGMYDFMIDSVAGVCRVQGAGKVGGLAQVVTRTTGDMRTTPGNAIVFDVVGDKYFLAEIWIPGQDGYILHIQKGAHAHKVLMIQK